MSTINRQGIKVITAAPRKQKSKQRRKPTHLKEWVTLKVAADACGISKQGFISEYVDKGLVGMGVVDGLSGYLICRSDLVKIVGERQAAGYDVQTTVRIRGTK